MVLFTDYVNVPLRQWWPLLGLVGIVLHVLIAVIDRRFFDRKAKIPGPFLPAVTRLYAWYFNGPKEGKFYKEIERLHSIYGPIVRIAPNEIHLSDPEDYDKVYAIGSKFYKDPQFYGALGIDAATFATVPNDLHRLRRAALNPFFSRRTVLELEDVVHQKVEKLCGRIQKGIDQGKPTDLHSAFRAVSMDVITDYAFDESYNHLDREDFGCWFSDMVRGTGPMFWLFQQFPFLMALQKLPESIAKRMSSSVADFIICQTKTRNQVIAVQKKLEAGVKPKRTTIFHQLLDPNAAEGHVVPSVNDLADESFSVCTAAADTTGNAMTVAAYHVVTNPKIYAALKEELLAAIPNPKESVKFTKLEKLPYLTGVVKESLRLSFGVISRLPRVVGEGGVRLQGYFLPSGTVVSMSSWMMHRNPEAFPDPDTFDPTRWLDPELSRERERFLVPFSRGQRMCIGQNLAQCELYVTLGTMFRRFADLEAFEVGPEDMVYEDFFSAYHPLSARRFKVIASNA